MTAENSETAPSDAPAQPDERPLSADETARAWTFKDEAIAAKFDAHVREQLAWYDALSRYVADIAVSFIPTGGTLYDIGASTGNITRLLKDDLAAKGAKALSIEPSHQMARVWDGEGDLFVIDAERIDFMRERPDVTVMFLVLMFMKPSERDRFLHRVLDATLPGGAVIIVDKGYIETPAVQVACKAAHLAAKVRAGTPAESYVKKELSLRGEQRPTDWRRILDHAEGWNFEGETIFRFGEFYGLLLIKQSL